MITTPFDQIKKSLIKDIPSELIDKLPEKWEKIGDVVILKLPSELKKYYAKIGKIYAEILNCKSVLKEKKGISGTFREPNVELIYGSKNTETIHIENNIRYRLDPQKIMFSSGNMNERIHIAGVSNKTETVVDLFAGIGYFTIPIAIVSKPKKIYACEINKVAYDYLCKNIVLNDATSNIKPLFGNNREVAPKNVADRVIMGFIKDTYRFLPVAFNCLKDSSGFVHYHEVCPDELLPDHILTKVNEIADRFDRKIRLIDFRKIKSYAPGISHAVLDLQVGEK